MSLTDTPNPEDCSFSERYLTGFISTTIGNIAVATFFDNHVRLDGLYDVRMESIDVDIFEDCTPIDTQVVSQRIETLVNPQGEISRVYFYDLLYEFVDRELIDLNNEVKIKRLGDILQTYSK